MNLAPVRWRRAGGVLLHPTSLPGEFGVGDLGPMAERWLAWLGASGCRLWQILPLGPVGADASPYLSSSAFAGNPLLISPETLVADGLLREDELAPFRSRASEQADFDRARLARGKLLPLAAKRFVDGEAPRLQPEAASFFEASAGWLDDFALFNVIQSAHDGSPWQAWPPALASREPGALAAFSEAHREKVQAEKAIQYFFERQWARVREMAQSAGIGIIGDIPIFVSHDSADVWAHRELFKLDDRGMPTVVAGVPPDYFSATGQRWGNPIYDWEQMEASGFRWWVERLRRLLNLVDRIRLDHFRGFVAAWEIPEEAPTAEDGAWVPGPGRACVLGSPGRPGKPSDHRRGPGLNHPGCGGAAGSVWIPWDESAAIRLPGRF